MRKVSLGTYEVYQLNGGKFALDGGAMFGVVPKVIWEKLIKPDEFNRIPMATHPLLVKTNKFLYLVDVGIGKGWDEKFKRIYDVLEEDIFEGLDYGPEDIDFIIATHLHFDHMAGAVENDEFIFKKAKIYVQNLEWADANFPHIRSKASYIRERIEPLKERIILIDGDKKIDEKFYVMLTGGHTRGHQIVLIENLLFMADLVPTVHHIHYPYIMGYDLYPVDTLYARYRIYDFAYRNNLVLAFEHDREAKLAYLTFKDDKPSLIIIE
jgi:glyoxylase-like metal-dependent hydrolase (beta-lactamase superfamily II)